METEKKLEEQKRLYALWEKTGLLRGIDDEHLAIQVTTLLENQRLHNQNDTRADAPHVMRFRRNSIPIVRRVFGNNFIPNDIISLQAMVEANCSYLWVDQYRNKKRGEVPSRTRGLKTPSVEYYFRKLEHKSQIELDNEAAVSLNLSNDLRKELTREIIGDLRIHAGIKLSHEWQMPEKFVEFLMIAGTHVERKIGRRANWLFVSWDLAQKLSGLEEMKVSYDPEKHKLIDPEKDIFWLGSLGKWTVYVDNIWPAEKILIGYKGEDDLDSGYFYCPFIVLGETTVDADSSNPSFRLMMRYGKKLMNPDYYGVIELGGYTRELKMQAEETDLPIEMETVNG